LGYVVVQDHTYFSCLYALLGLICPLSQMLKVAHGV